MVLQEKRLQERKAPVCTELCPDVFHVDDKVSWRSGFLQADPGLDVRAVEKTMLLHNPLNYLLYVPVQAQPQHSKARFQMLESSVGQCVPSRDLFLHSLELLCTESFQPAENLYSLETVNTIKAAWDDPVANLNEVDKEVILDELSQGPALDERCVQRHIPKHVVLQALQDAFEQCHCCSVANIVSLGHRMVCMHQGNLNDSGRYVTSEKSNLLLTPTRFSNFRSEILPCVGEAVASEVSRAEQEWNATAAEREAKALAKKLVEEQLQAELAEQSPVKGQKNPVAKSRAPSRATPSPSTKKKSDRSSSSLITAIPEDKQVTTEDVCDSPPVRSIFAGCNMGADNIIRVSERHSVLLADDVDNVCVSLRNFEQSNLSCSVTVRQGEHVFAAHRLVSPSQWEAVLDGQQCSSDAREQEVKQRSCGQDESDKPIDQDVLDAEFNELPKPGKATCVYSGFVANIKGMVLAGSWYPSGRPTGLDDHFKEDLDRIRADIAAIPTVAPPSATDRTPVKGKKQQQLQAEAERLEADRKAAEELKSKLQEERQKVLQLAQDARLRPIFPSITLNVPNGLTVNFSVQHTTPTLTSDSPSEPGTIHIRQSYSTSQLIRQDKLDEMYARRAEEEKARIIHADGRVVVLLRSGNCKLMYPDGTVIQGVVMSSLRSADVEAFEATMPRHGCHAREWSAVYPDGETVSWTVDKPNPEVTKAGQVSVSVDPSNRDVSSCPIGL